MLTTARSALSILRRTCDEQGIPNTAKRLGLPASTLWRWLRTKRRITRIYAEHVVRTLGK